MADDNNSDAAPGRTEALAALGQVSAGVTHEVRNVMTGILGFVQVARKRLATRPEAAAELLELIELETQRCVEILTQFLSFTRPQEVERAPVDLTDVVKSAARLAGHQLMMSGVQLEVAIADDLPRVMADGGALRQVVLNLLINAMQACAGRSGQVRIVGQRLADGSVELQVHDDGPGIAAEVADHIFDPFYTTKVESGGTGMGLAMSRAIIEEHAGTLALVSPPGRGAIFSLKLPGLPR